jgi:hypothetical protein
MQPRLTGPSRARRERDTAKARVAGAALLGLAVLGWWMLRAAGAF